MGRMKLKKGYKCWMKSLNSKVLLLICMNQFFTFSTAYFWCTMICQLPYRSFTYSVYFQKRQKFPIKVVYSQIIIGIYRGYDESNIYKLPYIISIFSENALFFLFISPPNDSKGSLKGTKSIFNICFSFRKC